MSARSRYTGEGPGPEYLSIAGRSFFRLRALTPDTGLPMERVATDTGAPVRSAPLPGGYPGATAIDADEVAAVREVLERRSPFRYYGPEVAGAAEALERAFAARLGVAHALGISSGTAALIVALRAPRSGAG